MRAFSARWIVSTAASASSVLRSTSTRAETTSNLGDRALLDQALVVRELRARQLDRFAFDLFVAQRENQVPVSPFDLGDDLDCALAELAV